MAARHKPGLPALPPVQAGPILHATPLVERWFWHYWQRLGLPESELVLLALTQDRREYQRWTGKRLNFMVLGCYCYVQLGGKASSSVADRASRKPGQLESGRTSPMLPLPGFGERALSRSASAAGEVPRHRHCIFIEPDMQPRSIEVTVAHELIHLADRVRGTPRRHRHHGYDSIAADEAAITGYDLEELRQLLYEESARREQLRRARAPLRYIYVCPNCGKEYPRARRYSRPVSCSLCDKTYNPRYRLLLARELL
ncbi:MAG: hypothetical protein IMW90_05310 [Thermogemmatispora sp.]|jgi:hypothetical protein|uniref:hypothetical protein n=1 Tax=Thermogemmatispora sp. TaxID=1968838 RepID=UPI0019DA7A39|nr:hypothetical protein [Thermogemmatispora sp.]MBE3565127.1 hypothetical protein [Thermogemmatispora sp.]